MFPTYIYEKDTVLPEEGFFYVIAGNGIFMHKETDIVSLYVPSTQYLEKLQKVESRIKFKLPNIPFDIFYKARYFFKQVWDTHHGEAEVNLYFHPETREYALCCHEQEVSAGGVNYGTEDINDPTKRAELLKFRQDEGSWGQSRGYRKVGSIHSHCNFSAFHSGTDIHDEESFDGIHITIGHVDCENVSLAASLVANGNRFQVEPESVIDGINTVEGNSGWFADKKDRYSLDASREELEEIEKEFYKEVHEEWMPKVQKRKWAFKEYKGSHSRWFGWGNSTNDDDDDNRSHRSDDGPAARQNRQESSKFVLPIDFALGTADESRDIKYYHRKVLKKVKYAAMVLAPARKGQPLAPNRLETALSILKRFFKKDIIADSDIDFACKIDLTKGLVAENGQA